MKGTPQQQWSVHAEFHISHPGAADPKNPPKTGTLQDDKGVRMLYTWSTADNAATTPQVPTTSNPSVSHRPPFEDGNRLHGFQRGNLFFTSTPPRRYPGYLFPPPSDSGYGSDLLSPNSHSSSLPRRNVDPYHRKCRSTCNIILSNVNDQNLLTSSDQRSQCGRTQSLRCQTPAVCNDGKHDGFYGCGDPWCHHLHYSDELSARRISPVKEVCEEVRANCTCAICDPQHKNYNKALKRDVSVQTFEMVNKCTSPLMKMDELNKSLDKGTKKPCKLKRGKTISPAQSRSQSMKRTEKADSPSSTSQQPLPKLSRSPISQDLPTLPVEQQKSSSGETKLSDSSKKPRTIHIDVYCTGTDLEAESSSDSNSESSKSASTPQTVFESKKMCVKHKKADNALVPYTLRQKILQNDKQFNTSTSLDKDESDVDDDESTAYPSKLSSYSNLGYSLSTMSSFPNSITPYSMSSCTVPDTDVDSVTNTSWKDTFSDIDSLLHSRSSVTQNDSLYFIPKRIEEENENLSESSKNLTASTNLTATTNSLNLQGSDSFEYANSEDKLRIKKMEKLWTNKSTAPWKHAPTRRKLFSQQKQLQDAVNKRLSQMDQSKETDSEGSDESAKGWTFVKKEEKNNADQSVRATASFFSTSKRCCSTDEIVEKTKQSDKNEPKHSNMSEPQIENTLSDKISDTSSCPSKSPISVILKQRLTDPIQKFSNLSGQYSHPRMIAQRFGPVIDAFKKPGHHIGPVKNPHCSCAHCRHHFETLGYRNRTASVGDTYVYSKPNWEDVMNPMRRSTSEKKPPEEMFADF